MTTYNKRNSASQVMSISQLTTQTNDFLDILKVITANFTPKDRLYITTDITWSQYENITKQLSNQSHYRTSYLDGTVQIMSPGRNHEKIKEYLSSLLEAYFQEAEIDYYPLGSTTFRLEPMQVGKEPDFCYCLRKEKEFPDLAVEVIFCGETPRPYRIPQAYRRKTQGNAHQDSGGIDILEIYKRLQVKEVWLWQNNEIKIYCLNDNNYTESQFSQLLPDLDISLLLKYLSQSNLRLAIKEFRQELQK